MPNSTKAIPLLVSALVAALVLGVGLCYIVKPFPLALNLQKQVQQHARSVVFSLIQQEQSLHYMLYHNGYPTEEAKQNLNLKLNLPPTKNRTSEKFELKLFGLPAGNYKIVFYSTFAKHEEHFVL